MNKSKALVKSHRIIQPSQFNNRRADILTPYDSVSSVEGKIKPLNGAF